jgi:CRP-like cAMP-binding protein
MSLDISSLFRTAGTFERRLPPGTYLFHQGKKVESLFVVKTGEVQLVRHQTAGNPLVLQRAFAGAIVAEASAFAEAYHCDAIAGPDTSVRGISRPRFLELFRTDPNLAEAWAARLAREIQTTRLRSEILALKTVADRLDAWLAWHGSLPPKGEWHQIARQIAVSPEALYRQIASRRRGKKLSIE